MSLSVMVRLFALTLAAAALLLTGCSGGESNVERGNREGVLYWGNGQEPQELDPHITTGLPAARIHEALFEGLVELSPGSLNPVPGAAQSWSVSEDGKTYTFQLRENARWSNGDPLTAVDFQWSLWRAMHPKLGNQYSYMYYPIKNATAFSTGELQDFSQVGVNVLDKHTLQIELENPTAYFPGLLAHHSYYPVHRATIEKFGEAWERGTHWTRPGNMVSNGPFQLHDWRLFKAISVSKNPYYHGAEQIALNGIRFIPTENITTEERMYRAGQLHFTYELPHDKIKRYRENHPDLLMNNLYLGTYFYRINTTKIPELGDVRIRRALAMAVNRQQIVEKITKAGEQPAYTITPPGTAGYFVDSPLSYDPEKARALLAEAGYPDGKGFPTIELLYNTLESHRKIAVAVQQMWKKELNINIELRNEDWKVYLNTEKKGDFFMTRGSWIGDYVDPKTFLELWISNGGNNRTRWSNPEYDRLILKAAPTASTQQERFALLQQAETILLSELPVIPIYTYATKHLVHPSVKGLTPNLLDAPLYKHIYIEPVDDKKAAK